MALPRFPTIYTVLLLSLILPICFANASQDYSISRRNGIVQRDRECKVDGSTDLYGFGVRLGTLRRSLSPSYISDGVMPGIYLQQLTSYLANTMYVEEINSSLAANAIFLFALLLAMIKGSADGSLHVIDGLILLNLCYSFLFSVLTLFGYRTLLYQPSNVKSKHGVINGLGGFGTYFRLFLTAAVTVYAIWYWTTGIYHLQPSYPGGVDKSEPCSIVIWLFGTFSVLGGVRWLMRVGSVLSAIYFGGLSVVAFTTLAIWLAATFWEFFKGARRKSRQSKALFGNVRREWYASKTSTGTWKGGPGRRSDQKGMARHSHIVLRILNLIVFVFGIISIELNLNVNHVQGVLVQAPNIWTPGQLLPLFIGLFSLLRIVWLIWVHWLNEDVDADEDTIPLSTVGRDADTTVAGSDTHSDDTKATHAHDGGGNAANKLQAERNIVFSVAAEWLPWIFSLEFMRDIIDHAANAYRGADENVMLLRRKARWVRRPQTTQAVPFRRSTDTRLDDEDSERV